MKKIIFLVTFFTAPLMLADATTGLVNTVETYKVLQKTAGHPDATTQQLIAYMTKEGYDFEENSSHIMSVAGPASPSDEVLKTMMNFLYTLMVRHNQTTIKYPMNVWMSSEKTMEDCSLYLLLEKITKQSSLDLQLEFIITYCNNVEAMLNPQRIRFPQLQLKLFYSIILGRFINAAAQVATKTFNFSQQAKTEILKVCKNLYKRSKALNIFTSGLHKYTPALTLQKDGWRYNELDIMYILEPNAENLAISLEQAIATNDRAMFKTWFTKYLNELCWVYRSTMHTYVASRAAGSTNTTPPPGKDIIMKLIKSDRFQWQSLSISVPRYAGDNRNKNLNSPRTLTVGQWMTYQYFK